MNILIAIISTFGYNTQERKYTIRVPGCDVEAITAVHTNESILKCLVHLESVRQSGGLNKVIALVSNGVQTIKKAEFNNSTALGYFRDIIEKFAPGAEVVSVPIENDNAEPINTAAILQMICDNISSTDNVYIDCAGGKRTTNYIIQVLTKILNYTGVNTPCTLYSDIQNNVSYIVDNKEYERMTYLADAFNEFMTTGKADQLKECMKDKDVPTPFGRILDAISEFSDKIRLGRVHDIDTTIQTLKSSIAEAQKIDTPDKIESVILKQFFRVIEEKLIGTGENKTDYAKLIKWCLDNVLVQQALTLFVEKIPVYLFEKKAIQYKGNISQTKSEYKEKRNKIEPVDWETYAVFCCICDGNGGAAATDPTLSSDVSELKRALTNSTHSSNAKVEKVIKVLSSFKKNWPNSSMKNETADYIRQRISKTNSNTYAGFVKMLCNEPNSLKNLLDPSFVEIKSTSDDIGEDATLAKKFTALEYMKTNKYVPHNFMFSKGVDGILPVLYGYLYVKIMRNMTNHASSNDIMTEKWKSALGEYGYDFRKVDLKTIIYNISLALEAVNASIAEDNVAESCIVQENYSTDLIVGDEITAYCHKDKSVRIEGYDYDIQLIVPKPYKSSAFLGRDVNVKIKQISSFQKIMQVEIIV